MTQRRRYDWPKPARKTTPRTWGKPSTGEWVMAIGAALAVFGLPYLVMHWPDITAAAQSVGAWLDQFRTAALAPWGVR